MQTIGQQLGELFLQAVPIVLILLVFYVILKFLFFGPLLKVMVEREARTIGAQKEAEAAQAAAAEKKKQYQDALKQARTALYVEQENARKRLLDARAQGLKDARAKAATVVAAAKERIEQEFTAAQREVETSNTPLAAQVARRVLQSTRPPGARPRETR
jgi:F-type H+-transporting ATPase subunit b